MGHMGYRGKQEEQAEARRLRAESLTLAEIADTLGVSKSSVSLWVRDVDFTPRPKAKARRRGPNVLQLRKADEIERLRVEGVRVRHHRIQLFTDSSSGDGSRRGAAILRRLPSGVVKSASQRTVNPFLRVRVSPPEPIPRRAGSSAVRAADS